MLLSHLRSRFAVAAGLALVSTSAAMAGTNTGTLTVQVRVNGTCVVGASTLNFGQWDDLSAARNGSTTVAVTCPTGQTYSVSVPTANQTMTSGANSITYRVAMDAGLTAGTLANQTGTGAAQNVTVYGQIPIATAPAAGVYTGTVTVTVSY